MNNIKLILFSCILFPLLISCEEETPPTPPDFTGTVWSGPTITFTKADEADPTDPANQDRLTDNVIITRGNQGGQIYNIASETMADKNTSPAGTEWAIGKIDNVASLQFKAFRAAVTKPQDIVGEDLVLHLIEDDIFLAVKFTAWSGGQKGGFRYERSTAE
ncbi:MAG: hypothetical protein AAF696_13155 [Bacteroidota bacterium]